jgi:hypothetical protein
MLQLSVAILNGPEKCCSSTMVPNMTNSSFSLLRPTRALLSHGRSRFDRYRDGAPIDQALMVVNAKRL